MNIAFLIAQNYDPNAGGVQRSTSKLAEIFKHNKHNTIVISLSKTQENTKIKGVDIFTVSKSKGLDHYKFTSLLKTYNIDIVINQAGFSLKRTKYLLKLQQKVNFKIINTLRINPLNFITNHEMIIEQYLKSKKIGFLNSKLLRALILKYHKLKQAYELNFIVRHVDAFVMLSGRFKAELFQITPKLKQYEDKLYGINNPFPQPNIKLGVIEKENIILFVGRLNITQKRVDLLLEIWKKLHHQLPDWKFCVAGDGPEKKNMMRFCSLHNLDRVEFFGQCDPNPLYQKAKILHMTSAFEGFGNVLVEAQSHAVVPVMFNSYSAAQDIVIDKQTGVLVKPFDIEEYTKKTLELIQSKNKLKKLSKKAYSHSKSFSFENTYKKWEVVFASI